jgi:hypothetical protein
VLILLTAAQVMLTAVMIVMLTSLHAPDIWRLQQK